MKLNKTSSQIELNVNKKKTSKQNLNQPLERYFYFYQK